MAFSTGTVNRMRNLVQGDYHAKTEIQGGYTGTKEVRGEGSVWVENGKTWTITNGIITSLSSMDLVKDVGFMPLFCPCCKKPMRAAADEKMFRLRSKCLRCVSDEETQMRIDGTYQQYERQKVNENLIETVEMAGKEIEQYLDLMEGPVIDENGNVEEASMKTNKQLIISQVQETIRTIKEKLSDNQ